MKKNLLVLQDCLLNLMPLFIFFIMAVFFSLTKSSAQSPTPPNLGTANDYAILSNGAINASARVACRGNVGSAGLISYYVETRNFFYPNNTGNVSIALTDLSTAIASINGLTATIISGTLGGTTFSAGVYRVTGKATLTGTMILTGDSSSVYIFDVDDSLIVSNHAKIQLNGVFAKQVFINIGKSLMALDTTELNGTFLISENVNGGYLSTGSKSFLCSGITTIQSGQSIESPRSLAAGLISPFQTFIECGLDYKMASVALNKRFLVCPPTNAGNVAQGFTQPATLNIAGIPANSTLFKAYIYISLVGNASSLSFSFNNLPISATLVASDNTHQATCWNVKPCYTDPNNCVQSGSMNFSNTTQTWRAEVQCSFFGFDLNGNYPISGLPTLACSGVPEIDVSGATLIIIYQDPADPNTGNLLLYDGLIVNFGLDCIEGNFDLLSLNFPPMINNSGKAFMLASDLQDAIAFNPICGNPGEDGNRINGAVLSSFNPLPDLWNQQEITGANFINGNIVFRVKTKKDCFSIAAQGLYYKTANICCSTPDVNLTFNNSITASALLAQLPVISSGIYAGNVLGNTISNLAAKMLFKGGLVIDQPITFLNCTNVTFGNNTSVTFTGTNPKLALWNNTVFKAGCDQPWNGIILNASDQSLNVYNGSTIQDAYTGIYINENGGVNIIDAIMNHNLVHLKIQNLTINSNPHIVGSLFKCDGTFYSTCGIGTITYRAIELIDNPVSIQIGLQTYLSYMNTFQDYSNAAIYCSNTNLTVYNNLFNASGAGTYTALNGILAVTTAGAVKTLIIGNYPLFYPSTFPQNTFNNHMKGINVNGKYSLQILENTFNHNRDYSIRASKCVNTLNIRINYIYNTNLGIFVFENTNVPLAIIDKNTLENSDVSFWSNNTTAIVDQQTNNPPGHISSILANIITNFSNGISGLNEYNWDVRNQNTITYSGLIPTSPSYGIRSQGCTFPRIQNNTLSNSIVGPSSGFYGISAENGTTPYLCSNSIIQFYTGINCIGVIYGTKIKLNIFTTCHEGFALRSGLNSTEIGLQGDFTLSKASDNQWITCAESTRYYDSNNGNPPSDFVYNSNLSANYFPSLNFFTGNAIPMSPQGISGPFGTTASCGNLSGWKLADDSTGNNPASDISNDSTLDNTLANYIASEPPLLSFYPVEENWQRNNTLYHTIVTDSVIDLSILALADFVDSVSANSVGKFYQVDSVINLLNSSVDSNIVTLDSTLLNAAININSSIIEDNLIETYFKQVNSIYIKSVAVGNDSLGTVDWNTLWTIAKLCSVYYGEPVIRARIIINSIDSVYHYFPDDCSDFNLRLINYNENRIYVYPNPGSDKVNILFDFIPSSNSKLLIYDIFGNQVYAKEIQKISSFPEVNLSAMRSGIYFISLLENTKVSARAKLILIR